MLAVECSHMILKFTFSEKKQYKLQCQQLEERREFVIIFRNPSTSHITVTLSYLQLMVEIHSWREPIKSSLKWGNCVTLKQFPPSAFGYASASWSTDGKN